MKEGGGALWREGMLWKEGEGTLWREGERML